MAEAARGLAAIALVLLALVAAGLAVDELTSEYPERAELTVADENGTELGTVSVRVADTWRERVIGLSTTDGLGPNEGMLFVLNEERNHSYVMRGMDFPIDIVFVGADRRITAVHHAEVESPPYTKYRGRGKWGLEVPYRWTIRHNVTVGDRVRIDWGS